MSLFQERADGVCGALEGKGTRGNVMNAKEETTQTPQAVGRDAADSQWIRGDELRVSASREARQSSSTIA